MIGAEESEMPDLRYPCIRRRHGEDFRFDRSKARTQKFDGAPSGPRIVGKTDRAHRALVPREIRHSVEAEVVEEIARAVHPPRPLQKNVLRQVFAKTAPPRRVTQQ